LPFALANGKACGECLHWPEANAAALPFAKANGKSLCHVEFKPSTLLFAKACGEGAAFAMHRTTSYY
jgi:hypothetical protein